MVKIRKLDFVVSSESRVVSCETEIAFRHLSPHSEPASAFHSSSNHCFILVKIDFPRPSLIAAVIVDRSR